MEIFSMSGGLDQPKTMLCQLFWSPHGFNHMANKKYLPNWKERKGKKAGFGILQQIHSSQ